MKTNSRHGMTLVEILVAMSISVVVLGGVMSTFLAITRSSIRISNYFAMEQETARGLEQLGRDLRMAQSITTTGSPITQVTLTIPAPTGTATSTVVYRFDTSAQTFVRVATGKTTILIRDVLSDPGTFGFERYDLAQQPAASDYGTNQIQISMTLSPATHGLVASTTKRVISSRFVLRNR